MSDTFDDRSYRYGSPNQVRQLTGVGASAGSGGRTQQPGAVTATAEAGWDYLQGRGTTRDGTQPGLGPAASTGQILDYIAENYPGMVGFFNTNQEIRSKLVEAAKWGWSPSKLQAEVQATTWYRTTSNQAREFEILQSTNPAEAQAQVAAIAASIQNSAQTMGVGLAGSAIAGMAWQAARNGWTDAQTIDALLANLDWSTVEGGQLTATRDDIKAVAGQFLVDVSDTTAQQYAARIASGELTLEGVRSIMQRQATGRFSWLSDTIDQGVTPADYFAPVRDVIARTLEVAPDSINLMDPRWLGLVEVRDRETGQMRAATLNEAMLSARGRSEFVNTQGAGEMSAGLIQMAKEAFGL
jgi:hypothetical protein